MLEMLIDIIIDIIITDNLETLRKLANVERIAVILEVGINHVNAYVNANDREELFADLAD